MPLNRKTLLRVDENTTELFKFLAQQVKSLRVAGNHILTCIMLTWRCGYYWYPTMFARRIRHM